MTLKQINHKGGKMIVEQEDSIDLNNRDSLEDLYVIKLTSSTNSYIITPLLYYRLDSVLNLLSDPESCIVELKR